MHKISGELKFKLGQLEKWYSQRKGSIVAFSGGIDSTLVLFFARRFQGKNNAIGVISKSESLKNSPGFIPFSVLMSLQHSFSLSCSKNNT